MSTTRTPNAEVRERRLDASTYDRWFDIPWGRYAFNVEVGVVLEAMGSLADGVSPCQRGLPGHRDSSITSTISTKSWSMRARRSMRGSINDARKATSPAMAPPYIETWNPCTAAAIWTERPT